MALFSKPPTKRPAPTRPEPKLRGASPGVRPASARDVVNEIAGRPPAPSTGAVPRPGAKVIGMPVARSAAIEIERASDGLCAPLENAALLFASGQAPAARSTLEDAVAHDAEARGAELVWLSLFDLLRRDGDRPAFDRLALEYVVQFERSAPSWEELRAPGPGPQAGGGGGTLALAGQLSGAGAPQMDALERLGGGAGTQAKLDLGAVTGYDDAGARLLAEALGGVRRRRAPLLIERADGLRARLEAAVNEGREAGEGAWLLLLELLQWQGEPATFDDRAIDYAVTFEVSPPSWEPPARPGPPPPKRPARGRTDAEVLAWSDEIKGPAPGAVAELIEFAQARSNVLVDMTHVVRIDFVSGGALANVLQRLATGRKAVQIVGATPIVRALLLLVGVSGELFVRKAA